LTLLQAKGYKGRTSNFHFRRPTNHATKNFSVSSAGRVFSHNAPSGKSTSDILGDAHGRGMLNEGPHRTGIVLPPSYPHKPSASLYGGTSQWKKSSVRMNIPHKPFVGGDGHPPRKAAVHAGVPQAKKLPASDKTLSVRCMWPNKVVAPVQRIVTEVSSNPPSASTASRQYRAPSPPGATNSRYPQDDLRLKLERMHLYASQETKVFIFTFTLVLINQSVFGLMLSHNFFQLRSRPVHFFISAALTF